MDGGGEGEGMRARPFIKIPIVPSDVFFFSLSYADVDVVGVVLNCRYVSLDEKDDCFNVY